MRICALLAFVSSLSACAMRPPELTGIWQDIPYWASRWSNSYAFFPDGRYTYRTNEMDCARREMSVSGQWVVRGQKLALTATEKIVRQGGKLEPATGSCASDNDLVDAQTVTVPVAGAVSALPIAHVELVDEPNYARPGSTRMYRVVIGDQKFWRMKDDPADY